MGFRIEAVGLREMRRALKAVDAQLPRELRLVLNQGSKAIAAEAVPRMPKKTESLRKSVRPRSTQTEGRVMAGNAKVPYAGFIEFGGKVGKNKSVRRKFVKEGRYLYPAFERRGPQIKRLIERAFDDLARTAERG